MDINLSNSPVHYITRDIERALGLDNKNNDFFIISNNTSFAKKFGDNNLTVIDNVVPLSTRELMEQSILPSDSNIIVFKNTRGMERIAYDRNWKILNPSAILSNTIEEKISQVAWLGALSELLPPHSVSTCKDLLWSGEQYVVQYNHAHSGEGTLLISSERDTDVLKEKFPNRPVRVTQFIDGPLFTVNAVIHSTGVMISSPSYQITGVSPFTNNKFTTIGNDWGAADQMLSDDDKNKINNMAKTIGHKMKEDGWKGVFGIDVVRVESTEKIYLIEINARQPASVTYESHLQYESTETQEKLVSTFEAHLAALLDIDLNEYSLAPITNGAQIIQRITEEVNEVTEDIMEKLEALGCSVIEYGNERMGSELLRIQSGESFIEKHDELNNLGKNIARHLDRNEER